TVRAARSDNGVISRTTRYPGGGRRNHVHNDIVPTIAHNDESGSRCFNEASGIVDVDPKLKVVPVDIDMIVARGAADYFPPEHIAREKISPFQLLTRNGCLTHGTARAVV